MAPKLKHECPIGVLRYNGIIDLDGLFQVTRDWFVSNKWKFYEKTLKHKLGQEGIKKEMTWTAYRDLNEYCRFNAELEFLIREITEVEVVRAGVKKKLQQCVFQVIISGDVTLDKDKRFAGSGAFKPFLEMLQTFYHNYIIKEDIAFVWWDQLYYRLMKLQGVMKQYLDMEAKTNAAEARW